MGILEAIASSKAKPTQTVTECQCPIPGHISDGVFWATLYRLGVRDDELDEYMLRSVCERDFILSELEIRR